MERSTGASESHVKEGTLAAVAVFSNARRWEKEGRIIRSYEWIRYASLKGLRVTGGMGKLLNAFISEVRPDDIMSYADTDYPDGGDAYRQLGFIQESTKECNGHLNIKYRLRPILTHITE
ncbi:uncharacterized protein BN459_01379 [Bacteroides sp. CAG:1060]|nr:uncharacterized protein BN459_01379 [Bacteroides sp. CAG:1060]